MICISFYKVSLFSFIFLCGQLPLFASCTETTPGNFICDNDTASPETEVSSLNTDTLSKTGSGEYILSGNNTVNTAVNINAGALSINSEANLAGSYTLYLNSGSLNTISETTFSNAVSANGGSLNNADKLTLNGNLTGSVLNKSGAGALYLNNQNLYGGAVNINEGDVFSGGRSLGGAISVSSWASLTFDETADTIYSGSITGGGDFNKTGSATLKLEGSNSIANATVKEGAILLTNQNNLSGNISLEGGYLASGDTLSLNNSITVNGGGFDVGFSGDDDDEGLTLTGTLNGASFNKKGTGLLTINTSNKYSGDINIENGAVLTTTESVDSDVYTGLSEDNSFILSQDTGGVFNGSVSGGGSFIKDGSGTITLNGNNTSDMFIYDGAFSVSSSGNIQGDINMLGGRLNVTGNTSLGASSGQKLFLDNETGFDRHSFNISAGTILEMGQNLVVNGAGSILKEGAGTLYLNNSTAGSHSGNFIINQGILEITDGSVLGKESSVIMINGGTFLVSDSTTVNREIAFQPGGGNISVAGGKELNVANNIRGGGIFVKEGAGTLSILNGQITTTGGTKINQGVLQGNAYSLAGNIENNATLNFLQDTDDTFLGILSGGGAVNKTGVGILSLTGSHNFTGVFNVLEGAVKGNSASITSDIYADSGAFVIFDQNADGAYSKSISGGGSVKKQGQGVLELSGTNTYSGNTIISGEGGILFSSDDNLGALSSKIVLENGNLSLKQNTQTAVARDIVLGSGPNYITVLDDAVLTSDGAISGSSFVKLGNGKLVLNGGNTHTGGTQISKGVLSISDVSSLGSGMLAVTGGTFNASADVALDMNTYISGAAGFDVDNGVTLTTGGILYGGGTINKLGQGVLVLGNYNSYTGGLDIKEGKVIGNADSILGDIKLAALAELDFNQETDGYYVGNITAAAGSSVNKLGQGLLIIEGDSENGNKLDMGSFNIKQGYAASLGNLTGQIEIDSGAGLYLMENAGGSLNNSGELFITADKTINFTGDITVKNGGVLVLEAAEGTANNTLSVKNGASSGDINLESGSKLNIVAEGVFATPQTLNLIGYEGVLTGVFTEVSVANSKRLLASVDYSSNGVISFLITRLLSDYSSLAGLGHNQKQIALALDKTSAAPGQDMEDILNAIDLIPSASGQIDAVTQLGGFIYPNIIRLNSFGMLKNNAYLRLDNNKEGQAISDNIWVQLASDYGDIKSNDLSEKLYSFSNGFVFGLDRLKEDDFRLGFVSSYTRHDLKHNGMENLDGDEYQAGVYTLFKAGLFDFKSTASAFYKDSTVKRDISFINRQAKSRSRSFGLNADTEISAKATDLGSFVLRPFIGAELSFAKRNSFAETGAGAANLNFDGDTVFYGSARGGVGLEKAGKSFSYYADLILKKNILNPETELQIYSQKYKLKPADDKVSYGARLGGAKNLSALLSVYADGGADFNSDSENLYFNIGIRSYW